MAKILSYFHLCPINDEEEFLGLSPDAIKGNVINTLGKNIIITIKLSNQKQTNSWTVLEKLSSKVVYDCNSKEYVGVFARKWIRCWPQDCSDINKVKKIKLSKPVHNLVSIDNSKTLVLYADGTCESLEYAIEARKEKKDLSLPQFKPLFDESSFEILNAAHFKSINETILFTYFVKCCETNEISLVHYKVDDESLRIAGPVSRIKLMRDEQSIKLCGCTVVDNTTSPQLVTIWSDRRIFMRALRINAISAESGPGNFVAMLNAIDVDQPLSILGISRDCIAIYGANKSPQEGATLLLYNTQFKVVESKQLFKVYFGNSRLWIVDTYIFLAVGQKLAAVSFRISKEQLSDMLGSQRTMNLTSFVDTECINVDAELEEVMEFDKTNQLHASSDNSMDNNGYLDDISDENVDFMQTERQTFEDVGKMEATLRSLQQHDVLVTIDENGDLLADQCHFKLSANTNDECFENKTISSLVGELERIGESEVAISNLIIPICIDSNLTNDLMTCVRSYSNISEKMLALSLKFVLDKMHSNTSTGEEEWHSRLNVILACSFETEAMIDQIRSHLSFEHIKSLLNHIFEALESNETQLEHRPQNDDSIDEDLLLAKWFSVIIDSQFHQLILSRDAEFIEKLNKWKAFIDNLLFDIQQTKTVSAMMYNLIDRKSLAKEGVASKWYSVEEVKLY